MQLTAQIWNEFLQLVREGHSPFKSSETTKSASEMLGIPKPLTFKSFIEKNAPLQEQLDLAMTAMKKNAAKVEFSLSDDFEIPAIVHNTQVTNDNIDFSFSNQREEVKAAFDI